MDCRSVPPHTATPPPDTFDSAYKCVFSIIKLPHSSYPLYKPDVQNITLYHTFYSQTYDYPEQQNLRLSTVICRQQVIVISPNRDDILFQHSLIMLRINRGRFLNVAQLVLPKKFLRVKWR